MNKMKYIFNIDPQAKPRMTQKDKWANRNIVTAYFAFRDKIRYEANIKGLHALPGTLNDLIFTIEMPVSWSQKKKDHMRGRPHSCRPDIDNYIKGILDCFGEDSHIHSICACKIWGDKGSISFETEDEKQPEQLFLIERERVHHYNF